MSSWAYYGVYLLKAVYIALITTMTVPIAMRNGRGLQWLIRLRVLQGLVQYIPAILMAAWFTFKLERIGRDDRYRNSTQMHNCNKHTAMYAKVYYTAQIHKWQIFIHLRTHVWPLLATSHAISKLKRKGSATSLPRSNSEDAILVPVQRHRL